MLRIKHHRCRTIIRNAIGGFISQEYHQKWIKRTVLGMERSLYGNDRCCKDNTELSENKLANRVACDSLQLSCIIHLPVEIYRVLYEVPTSYSTRYLRASST